MEYDSTALVSYIKGGKVRYYREYSLAGRIVFEQSMTYAEYVAVTGRNDR